MNPIESSARKGREPTSDVSAATFWQQLRTSSSGERPTGVDDMNVAKHHQRTQTNTHTSGGGRILRRYAPLEQQLRSFISVVLFHRPDAMRRRTTMCVPHKTKAEIKQTTCWKAAERSETDVRFSTLASGLDFN